MVKYGIAALILKLGLWAIWIVYMVIPQGSKFITMLNESLNSHVWDVRALLTPILILILMFGIGALIELFGLIGIMWVAKREIDRRF